MSTPNLANPDLTISAPDEVDPNPDPDPNPTLAPRRVCSSQVKGKWTQIVRQHQKDQPDAKLKVLTDRLLAEKRATREQQPITTAEPRMRVMSERVVKERKSKTNKESGSFLLMVPKAVEAHK